MPARVIDEAIDPAVTRKGAFDQVPDIINPSHIAENELRIAGLTVSILILQSRDYRRALSFVVTADHDLRSGSNKLVSTALADAAATTGDDYDLVRIKQACHSNLRSARLSLAWLLKREASNGNRPRNPWPIRERTLDPESNDRVGARLVRKNFPKAR